MLHLSSTNIPNYIREAKVRPTKNQLGSTNNPNYVREANVGLNKTNICFANIRPIRPIKNGLNGRNGSRRPMYAMTLMEHDRRPTVYCVKR